MGNNYVCNASPLILLARIDHLHLLPRLADRVLIPQTVMQEIEAGNRIDHAADRVRAEPGLTVIPDAAAIPIALAQWHLDPGETQVLAVAGATPGAEALIDDRAARRCARVLGLPVVGTLGVMALARRRGVLPALRPVVEQLRASGLRVSATMIDAILRDVGEG